MSSQAANILELMKNLLNSMDITEYEPAVPHMLVELFQRNVTDVLKKAQKQAGHRKDTDINEDDLRLALESVFNKSMLQMTRPEAMSKLAAKVNNQPLPPIPDLPEITLPDEYVSMVDTQSQVGSISHSKQ